MKLLFSEAKPEYSSYLFPYVIWAVPESGESPSSLFNLGFLPSSKNLDRFYLCRQVRVDLTRFRLSSENNRILRKCAGIKCALVKREAFDYTANRREFYKKYADQKFGVGVMSFERLDALFASRIVSHLLVFTDEQREKEVGTVTLLIEPRVMAYYYYSFYDLAYHPQNLGMFMMTTAVQFFAEQSLRAIYLGTCYSENALYKTQFHGAEFFNGFHWSANLKELKYLLSRDQSMAKQHLLETPDFVEQFYGQYPEMVSRAHFQLTARV